jgi:class 3 adenylate cyclase
MGWNLTATYLIVDVRGWSELVHALGPDPAPAADIVQRFWDTTGPEIKRTEGDVYAWRGDGLLVAYQGPDRMGRALEAADLLLAAVRRDLAVAVPGFSISIAITDGRAVGVPVSFGAQQSEELTGDSVNTAFGLVKWVAPGAVGLTCEISDWLARNDPQTLALFTWDPPRSIRLAGAQRLVRQGIPAGG